MPEHLEERMAILEAEVARLRQQVELKTINTPPWWEKIAGSFANDPVYDEAMKLGQEYRESLRSNPELKDVQ
jgi:hypothetical protein